MRHIKITITDCNGDQIGQETMSIGSYVDTISVFEHDPDHGNSALPVYVSLITPEEGSLPTVEPANKVESLADLLKLPIGTKLVLVANVMGPCLKKRTLVKITKKDLIFKTESKEFSFLPRPAPGMIEWRADGFKIHEPRTGRVLANYEFVK